MVRVDTVYNLVNFISNKESAGNTMKISEYNTIIEGVNIDILKQYYGLPEDYRAGQPIPPIAYEISLKVMDSLSQLKVRTGVDVPELVIDENGRAILPNNYFHFSSAMVLEVGANVCDNDKKKLRYRSIELLTDAQIGDRLGNSITMPTLKSPCMARFSNYFQFYPKNISRVELTYLRLPNTPKYEYTVDNDEIVFTDTGSVHFEFPEDMLMDITRKVLSYLNINLREMQVNQYIEMQKKEGV